MSSVRIGRLVLGLGLLVGVAAGVGLLLGFEPAQLPPALVNAAVYKLSFLAAVGLFAAGAVVLRYAGREERSRESTHLPVDETKALGEGLPGDGPFGAIRQRERERAAPASDKRVR